MDQEKAKGKYQILISKTPFGRDSNIANRLVTIIRRSSLSYYVEADFPNIWGIVQQLFLEFDISFLKQKCNLWNWGIFSWMRMTWTAVLPVKSPLVSQGAILTQMEAEKGQLQCELQQVRRFGGWCVCKRDGKPTRSHNWRTEGLRLKDLLSKCHADSLLFPNDGISNGFSWLQHVKRTSACSTFGRQFAVFFEFF